MGATDGDQPPIQGERGQCCRVRHEIRSNRFRNGWQCPAPREERAEIALIGSPRVVGCRLETRARFERESDAGERLAELLDCYNPPAARSVMPIILMRAKFALAGQSMDQMYESIKAAVAKNELTTPEPGGMAYMLSKQQYLNDRVGNWHPHLMFFVPVKDKMTWGEADIPGSPLMVNTHFDGAPEPVTEFMVTVSHWSDGTPFSGSSIHAEAH